MSKSLITGYKINPGANGAIVNIELKFSERVSLTDDPTAEAVDCVKSLTINGTGYKIGPFSSMCEQDRDPCKYWKMTYIGLERLKKEIRTDEVVVVIETKKKGASLLLEDKGTAAAGKKPVTDKSAKKKATKSASVKKKATKKKKK